MKKLIAILALGATVLASPAFAQTSSKHADRPAQTNTHATDAPGQAQQNNFEVSY
jgi:hypothetical protein